MAFLLTLFCSLEWYFKVLLSLLLGLEYYRQSALSKNKKHLSDIQVRDNKVFLKRKNALEYQAVIEFKLQQNRIFAEIKLHLKDEVQTEFICQDRFSSKAQYSLFMQTLRFNHL